MGDKREVFQRKMKTGVKRTPEFQKKRLATHSVDVGLKCGHGCTYCFASSLVRAHPAFKDVGKSPFDTDYSIVDPTVVERVKDGARKLKKDHTVMVCTYTDAWAPEAKHFEIGKGILESLLEKGDSQVRILTKNASVRSDFELMEEHYKRVIFGMSIAAPETSDAIRRIEQYASPIEKRVETLVQAHNIGLRTYAMLCPCLPGISSSKEDLRKLTLSVMPAEPEGFWYEPINARGTSLTSTVRLLKDTGNLKEARAFDNVRNRERWIKYAVKLTKDTLDVANELGVLGKTTILLYENSLKPDNIKRLKDYDKSQRIAWL